LHGAIRPEILPVLVLSTPLCVMKMALLTFTPMALEPSLSVTAMAVLAMVPPMASLAVTALPAMSAMASLAALTTLTALTRSLRTVPAGVARIRIHAKTPSPIVRVGFRLPAKPIARRA